MSLMADLRSVLAAACRAAADTLSGSPPSATSTPPTPQPTTPADQGTTDRMIQAMTEMMTTWTQAQERQAAETRELVLSLVQGRPTPTPPPVVGMTGDPPTTLSLATYDNDSMFPLPGGIAAVLAREDDEAEALLRLTRERADLAQQLAAGRSLMTPESDSPLS